MAEETDLQVGIEAKVGGTADAKALADAVESVGTALGDLVASAKAAQRVTDNMARGLADSGTNALKAKKSVDNLTSSYKEVAAAQKKVVAGGFATPVANDKLAMNPGRVMDSSIGNLSTKASRESAEASAFAAQQLLKYEKQVKQELDEQLKVRRQNVAAAKEARLASALPKVETVTGTGAGSAAAVAARMGAGGFQQDNSYTKQLKQDELDHINRLTNTRYSLYQVSTAAAVAGAGFLAFNGIVIKAAADYETAMAQISRTTGAQGAQLQAIRNDFVGLAQDIPVAFSELSKIGTLGGQLDVPAESLAKFTETTAKFSATTNVTSEAAATAFGRLDTLLPDVQGNYEALGSSILQVGVNSVATETEIIATTNQIAAAGAQAGFTADQVIGLAGSFASLGVAPEAARGTTVRVLSEITKAVTEGGESLDTFAQLSGQTAQQFRESWSNDAGGALISVLQGLQKEGSGAEQTLRGMGITAVRDINALLRLSQNVDTVRDSFADANAGFSQGTQLQDAFAVQAETLASKIQVLVNSVQAFFATIGQSGIGPIGAFVDGLADAAKAATELAENPFAQNIAAVAGVFTLVAGLGLLLAAALGRVGATALAARQAIATFGFEAAAAGGGVRGLTAALYGTSAAAGALRGALISTGIGVLIVGLGAAAAAAQTYADSFKSGADRANDAFGDFTELSDALNKDTAAAKEGAAVFGEVVGTTRTISEATSEWTGVVKDSSTGQIELANATTQASEATKESTYSIGENTAAVLANKLANDASIQSLIEQTTKYNSLKDAAGNATNGGTDFDLNGVLSKAAAGDAAGAKKIVEEYRAYLKGAGASITAFDASIGIETERAIELVGGALQNAADKTSILTSLQNALGVETGNAGAGLEELGTGADAAADAMDELKASVSGAFATDNAVGQLQKDVYDLVYALAEGSTSFNAFDAQGSQNLANLQSSIVSTIAAGQKLGIDATNSIAALFQQLQASGVDTAALLSKLSGMGISGVNVSSVKSMLAGTTAMSGAGQRLSGVLGQVAGNAKQAAAQTKSVGNSAAAAAPKIVTLVDYANDLAGVFNRSFDLRFGNQKALDTISSGWQKIADATLDANNQIRDAQIKLQQLTADKSIQEYFLGIANQYDDGLRAGEITGKLAEINADMADEQKKVTDAQAKSNKTLEGNSEAAIQNRAELTGLVDNYQSYITSLASSGLSQADLASKTQELRAQFIQQATQLGYNASQVDVYAQAFDDMSLAIGRVPRNITVAVNPNPALQALNEIAAKAEQVRASASRSIDIPLRTITDTTGIANQIRAEIALREGKRDAARAERLFAAANEQEQALAALRRSLSQVQGYQSGGYTGSGAVNKTAGVVHGKEFVVDAPNTQRLGLPFLNALNNGSTPTAPSMPNMTVVELSAIDRSLLAAAGNIQVTIPGVAIQQATAAANLNAGTRGTN